uniref:Alpha-L-fucosidase n=1 Tax=Kalanchoe fedtschenkoi TaxID=63787 RepID=A0A7N0U7L3_KALFE
MESFSSIATLLIWVSAYSVASVTAEPECKFPAIFNFGDSNSDTGGFSAAFGQAGPPAGQTYFRHPAGRYSDGRLVIDFIAESLGLPHLSAYLDAVGSNFSHGANFATAGSTIREVNQTLKQSGFSPFSLNTQDVQFRDFKRRSPMLRDGVFKTLLPKAEDFSQALYTFDIGQNDLTYGYFDNKTTDEVRDAIPDILDKFTAAVKNIYSVGGRYFWIHNTGPVGCLPYIMDRLLIRAPDVDRVGCATPFNRVAQQFNLKLKEAVVQLRKDLPEAAITYVDVYTAKYTLISHARKYGFENPLRACCGHGGKYNYNMKVGCGGTKMINGNQVVIAPSCKNPSAAINWDGVHYTEAANKWIFAAVSKGGAYADPPIPLKKACYRHE